VYVREVGVACVHVRVSRGGGGGGWFARCPRGCFGHETVVEVVRRFPLPPPAGQAAVIVW
jgi:hypothetical protein